ncbi:hypothetical protein [Streptomyces sp. B93]|uniref:hypothetical protein n=1 Tax=Streptomyces sp. B93 TaxID=2824875 RepID=UPI001B384A67|nr:hypothetical protein [Streptomyces sp. B93]MBQ1093744.1 hypothetical protein [Streptomyces sp. B93]
MSESTARTGTTIDRIEQTDQPPPTPGLTEAERGFVHKVAEHYRNTDNMAWNYGYVFGYLMICTPVQQRASQIIEALGVTREDVERVSQLLVTPGVFERRDEPGDDDFLMWLPDGNWPKAVRYSLVNMPRFHEVLRRGLEVLADAPPERRERIATLEHLYRHLAVEIPAVFDRYETATAK